NERRRQCEYGVKLIKEHHPEVGSLRDVTHEMLVKYVKNIDEIVYNRCDFVVSEIQRLQDACDDLLADNFIQFGKRMFETHDGLQNKYEVSCMELDVLVDAVKNYPEVIGARMMGGGFGGCTINLIENDAVNKVIDATSKKYKDITGKEMQVYHVSIKDGASQINPN